MNPVDKAKAIDIAAQVIRIAVDIVSGNREDITAAAKEISFLLTDMIPAAELAPFLDETARQWGELAANIAEEDKLAETKP